MILTCLSICGSQHGRAHVHSGEVVGTLTGGINKMHGEFSRDMFGWGGQASVQYAPHNRIVLEGRFGLGNYMWLVTPADLTSYPEYFGRNADYGMNYPQGPALIEKENGASFYTADLLINYVLIPRIAATVFVTAGVGLIDWSARTSTYADMLPNQANNVYTSAAVSIPLGAGVNIPLSGRVGLLLRLEHRLVFSKWMNDVAFTGTNDGLTSGMAGLTYQFTQPTPRPCEPQWEPLYIDTKAENFDPGALLSRTTICEVDHTDRLCYGFFSCEECCHYGIGCGISCSMECSLACCCCQCPGCCCPCCHHCCCNCKQAQTPPPPPPSTPSAAEPTAPAESSEKGDPQLPTSTKPAKKIPKNIRFKLDTDEFDHSVPETQKNLDELLKYMLEAPKGHEVIIEGHASSEGRPERNKVLSDLRAKRIRSWLLENGVEPEKIRGTVGYGSSMPRVQEPSPTEAKQMTPQELERIRAQNRRIELHVLKDAYEQSPGG